MTSPFNPAKVKTATNSNQQKAEAFGNCEFEAADGKTYKIPKGIPMDSNNLVTRSIINAARAAAEKGEEFTLTLNMQVKLVVDDSGKEDIQFS